VDRALEASRRDGPDLGRAVVVAGTGVQAGIP
jgi:hypothetical protein